MKFTLTIGELSARTGVAPSALRFYESQGLIRSERAPSGHRRYSNDMVRRVSFIRAAQHVGLSLAQVSEALASLPAHRTPNQRDWERLSAGWRPLLDARIAMMERLRDRLETCIGCGCLSMRACALLNPGDVAAERGAGPRYVLDDD